MMEIKNENIIEKEPSTALSDQDYGNGCGMIEKVPNTALCDHAYGSDGCWVMDNGFSCSPMPKNSGC